MKRSYYVKNIEQERAKARARYHADREARIAYNRAWKAANPDKVAAQRERDRNRVRDHLDLKKHRLDLLEQELVAGSKRPALCEVCGRSGRITFDHCHQHGHFRGWLCAKCNTVLGLCDDDPNMLSKLAVYLKRARKKASRQLTMFGI